MATTTKEAIELITRSKGNISQAAKGLGISRQQLHNIINKHSTVKEALHDARESMKDFAESKLFDGINEGNTALIIFYLKTQAKDRGYTERQELDLSTGGQSLDSAYATALKKIYEQRNSD